MTSGQQLRRLRLARHHLTLVVESAEGAIRREEAHELPAAAHSSLNGAIGLIDRAIRQIEKQ